MSNIDKRALREAAEKATSGKWERGDGNGNGGELLVYCDDALGSAVCEMTSEYNAIPKYQRINNLNFIAAANPVTVLALLDELEAKDRRIEEEIGRANREHHRGFMMACGHLKEHSNVHYADAAEMEIAALRKRINELENAVAGKGEAS